MNMKKVADFWLLIFFKLFIFLQMVLGDFMQYLDYPGGQGEFFIF